MVLPRKMIALAMSLVLVAGLCPAAAFAESGGSLGSAEAPEITGDLAVQSPAVAPMEQPGSKLAATSNAWRHDYLRAPGQTARSFLHVTADRLERVEYTDDGLIVETVSKDFKGAASRRTVSKGTYAPSNLADDERFEWGGFFSGSGYNYVVTGQDNPSESDAVAVFRVTKYTKDWAYVGSAEVKGGNTIIPFWAGTCDFEEVAGKLYVRTSHRMYKAADGKNHQANVQLVIDEASMAVEESYTEVLNRSNGGGYVSHSFSQHLASLNSEVYGLDHGDAYPRSVTVKHLGGEYADVIGIPGETGENSTGVSVGGFESSAARGTLLAAGNMTDLNAYARSGYDDSSFARNVWISVIKPDLTSSTRQLTSYGARGKESTSTPFLVKAGEDRFLVIWGICEPAGDERESDEYKGKVCYQFVDGVGTPLGGIATVRASLSDCQPVLFGGKAMWYVGDGMSPGFYSIDVRSGAFSRFEFLSNASVELNLDPFDVDDLIRCKTKGKCPKVVVTLNGRKLKSGVDYKRSFKVNRKKGAIVVKVKGKGECKGAGKVSRDFKVERKSIAECDIDEIAAQAFTGKPVVPKLKIRYGKKKRDFTHWGYVDGEVVVLERDLVYKGYVYKLKKGKDYKVTCKRNVKAGMAVVKIKGKGMFKGSVKKTFEIVER